MSRAALACILIKRAQENEYSRVALETPAPKFSKAGPKGGGWTSPGQQIDKADAYLRQRSGGTPSGIAGGLFNSLIGGVKSYGDKLKAMQPVQDKAAIPMQPTVSQVARQPDEFDTLAKTKLPTAAYAPPAQTAGDPYESDRRELASVIAKNEAATKPVYR
jgi:hypothetical protein